MQIDPGIPFFGLVLIVVNVAVAAVLPYVAPRFMGVQLFIAGMVTIIIAIVDLINPIGTVVGSERILLFIGGCINCSLGYYMVLLEIQKQGA
jgi:hypothetical protein